jgi:protoheme IX farnesyltransferase
MTDSSIEIKTAASPASDVMDRLATASDYYALLKPGVMKLVIFTGLVGLLVAPGSMHPLIAFAAILSIAVGAGGSAALNMWFEADIDGQMERTKSRPIPSGKILPEEALSFGVTLSLLSVLCMGLMVNFVAAALLLLTILYYTVFYTMWLKRRTPQNIVIGGASGALPPVIGWAAVTGTVTIESIALFAIIFMWTPPHFWALSLYRAGDYEKAGIPMMPVVKGKPSTRRQILVYTVLMLPVSLGPYFLGYASIGYGALAVIASLCFIYLAAKVWVLGDGKEQDGADADKAARKLFFFSLIYLFALFLELMLEHFWQLWIGA